jgi:hypothetical protein
MTGTPSILVIERLSDRIPIARDGIWVVLLDGQPRFQGTHDECQAWCDAVRKAAGDVGRFGSTGR